MASRTEYEVVAEKGDIIGVYLSDFGTANQIAREGAEFLGPCIIFEQIGRNPPEPVAIWSRA